MIPQITFPIPVNEIPSALEMLSQHLKGLKAEIDITQAMIKAVRDMCQHTNTKHYPDCRDGGTTECLHCHKEW